MRNKPIKIKVQSRFLPVLLSVFMVFCSVQLTGCSSNAVIKEQPFMTQGYYYAVYEGMTDKGAAFLACGTGGRLDRIFEDGTLENIPIPVAGKDLTKVLIDQNTILVCGGSGAMAYCRIGEDFVTSKGTGNEHIMDLVQFNGKYYACTDSGKILTSADGMKWKTGVQLTNKPVIAVVANDASIMAITGDTDIFSSTDGQNWDSRNYNKIYDGFAEKLSFRSLACIGDSFFVLGYPPENPDVPTVMFTYDDGESWMNVVSTKINDEPPSVFYPLTVNALCSFGDVMLAACDRGRVLTFTECPSCNTVKEVSKADLRCIAVSGNDVVFVAGDNFEFAVLTADDL